jgi:hypothetical protein
MRATKTPLAGRFLEKLDGINDQLCFSAFAAEVVAAEVRPLAAAQPDAFTTEIFHGNPHASRIHRRLADLPAFQADAISQACANSLQTGSEHLQAYFDEVRKLGVHLLGGEVGVRNDEGDDERLERQFQAWRAPYPGEISATAIYLRRRRNHLVHLHDEPASEMRNFLGSGAPKLTKFWAKRPTDLMGFDFSNRALDRFRIEDGYAAMNLLRICLREVDAALAAVLPIEGLARQASIDILARDRRLRGSPSALARKLRATLQMEYGAQVSEQTSEQIAAEVSA